MHGRRNITGSMLLALVLLCAACGKTAAPIEKTTVLPPDGGDLGKAYSEMEDAFKAADKIRLGRLLDPRVWPLDDKQDSWFAQFVERLGGFHPIGGVRQGERATLFVVNDQPFYAMFNATHTPGGWVFDSPVAYGTVLDGQPKNCAGSARFPCGAASAPDALVAGTVQAKNVATRSAPTASTADAMIDGIAVRILDHGSKKLKFTRLVLSGTGINPQMVARSSAMSGVEMWLNAPVTVVAMDVAVDGESAKLTSKGPFYLNNVDVTEGLTIEPNTPNRIRGSLQAVIGNAGQFAITFDVGTISECIEGAYNCGDD